MAKIEFTPKTFTDAENLETTGGGGEYLEAKNLNGDQQLLQQLVDAVNDQRFHPGDTTKAVFLGGSFLTTSSKAVAFTIPLGRRIEASGVTITPSSYEYVSIRQNGKYLVGGSTAGDAVPVSSIPCDLQILDTSVKIVLNFADPLDGTNNSPVGIEFAAQLTFS